MKLSKDSRFSWPFVILVAYLAAAVFVFDLLWRTVDVPFMTFATMFGVGFAVSTAVLVAAIWLATRKGNA